MSIKKPSFVNKGTKLNRRITLAYEFAKKKKPQKTLKKQEKRAVLKQNTPQE